MTGQIVIVTGASRGIGAATARLLGQEKASVVVNYRNAKAEADAVVRDIEASGGKAIAVQGDVGNEDDILRLFAETDRVFGTLTGLVNNAGITGGTKRRIETLTFAGIMETMRVNIAGQLLCAREAVKRMSTRPGLIDTDIHNDLGIPDRVARFGPKMPIGRAGTPQEVAEAIVWLLSDKASYVTGEFINVTGGAR